MFTDVHRHIKVVVTCLPRKSHIRNLHELFMIIEEGERGQVPQVLLERICGDENVSVKFVDDDNNETPVRDLLAAEKRIFYAEGSQGSRYFFVLTEDGKLKQATVGDLA